MSEDTQEIRKWFIKAAVLILLLGVIILGALTMAQ